MVSHKNICFVATVDSAVSAFLLVHLKELSKYYKITVIVNTKNIFFLENISNDILVKPVKFSRKINILNDMYCFLWLTFFLLKEDFEAVHSITPKAGFLAMLASFIAKVPVRIHTFTGQVWVTRNGLSRFFLKLCDKCIGRLTSYNFVDSISQRDFLIREGVISFSRSIVFGSGSVSGVDLKKFKRNKKFSHEIRDQLHIPRNAFVFLYLGRLNKDKGIFDLARAFTYIQDPDVYLIFVGSDEGDCVEKINFITSKKSSKIKFFGFTKKPQQFLSASDVICLPSYREGFGNVIIEAAAMGVPALASNIYGISDAVIHNKTGLLHSPGSYQNIFECLEFFIKNPDTVKSFGKLAKTRAIKEFDSDLMTACWVDFYKNHIH